MMTKEMNFDVLEVEAKAYVDLVMKADAHRRPVTAPSTKASEDVRYSLRPAPEDAERYRYSDREEVDNTAAIAKAFNVYMQRSDMEALSSVLDHSLSQTFVERYFHYQMQKRMKDSTVYKNALIDRRLYSKMISDIHYKPSKDTVLALAFSLQLTLPEAIDLLNRAGYTLSHSTRRDIILEYLFGAGICNLVEINRLLDRLGEKIIGR